MAGWFYSGGAFYPTSKVAGVYSGGAWVATKAKQIKVFQGGVWYTLQSAFGSLRAVMKSYTDWVGHPGQYRFTVGLTWVNGTGASTLIYRDGAQIGTVASNVTSYDDTDVPAGSHTYRVEQNGTSGSVFSETTIFLQGPA